MSELGTGRLTLSGVRLDAGGRALVSGLELELARGEIAALVAPSGQGKTTLLRTLVRLCDLAAGRIALDGVPIDEIAGPELRRRVALVAQHPVLLGPTVADDLAAGARGALSEHRAADLLRDVGLDPGFVARQSSELSGGEQARVAVARALAGEPQLLLLDEPSAALDTAATDVLAAALRGRAASGLTILLATHDPALLQATAARVIPFPDAEGRSA